MADAPFSAEGHPPFDPSIVQDPGVVADTMGGYSLLRVIHALPTSSVHQEAIAEIATPGHAHEVLEGNEFLASFAESLVSETSDRIADLTADRARAIGSMVALASMVSVTTQHATYGQEAIEEELRLQAQSLGEQEAITYREEDRLDVMSQVWQVLDDEGRRRIAKSMMDQLRERAAALPLPVAAQLADAHLQGLVALDGSNAGDTHNPWFSRLIEATVQDRVARQLTARSRLPEGLLDISTNNTPVDPGASAAELYKQGIEHALAYVAVGTRLLASQHGQPVQAS